MEEILVFGHKNPDTDSICSSLVKTYIETKRTGENYKAVRLGNVSKETKYALDYAGVEEPELISKVDEGQKVILVDHNEFPQSADGIENAKIQEVVDHHRIASFQTKDPLYYTAKPYGCTATILFEEFKNADIEIEKTQAILMLSAIVSDTLLLKSPTCTEKDVNAFNELEKIAGIDAREYGLEMLKAGTDLSTFSAEELINIDAKKVEENGKTFVIAQVNTVDINDVFVRKEEISFEIEKVIAESKLDLFVFVITDIINSNSKIIALGNDKEVTEKAFNNKLDSDDSMVLEGVVSRKKQILPQILEKI